MLKVLGENYYLDLDKIDDYVQIKGDKIVTTGVTESAHISIIKYETVKLMMEIIMDEPEEIDEQLGAKGTNNLSIPFKIAFNTLLYKKLLNKL
jgi:hypothetical protein